MLKIKVNNSVFVINFRKDTYLLRNNVMNR